MRNCLDTDIDPLKNVLGKIPICFITYILTINLTHRVTNGQHRKTP